MAKWIVIGLVFVGSGGSWLHAVWAWVIIHIFDFDEFLDDVDKTIKEYFTSKPTDPDNDKPVDNVESRPSLGQFLKRQKYSKELDHPETKPKRKGLDWSDID